MRGNVVLITGASAGIGAATAVLFASRGCILSLTGRRREGLKDTQQACVRAGAREEDILLLPADLQDQQSWTGIVDNTVNKFGRLDVLVNNAGLFAFADLENTSDQEYDTLMDVNVKAMFFLTQRAVPHLVQSKGNVVNVSSMAAQRPMASCIAYNLSKAAVDHFTRIVALDLADKNVRVNAVNPAGVRTGILERICPDLDQLEEFAKTYYPLGRIGEPEDIAKAIVFLADDEQSSFVTGTTLLMDGGYSLKGPI